MKKEKNKKKQIIEKFSVASLEEGITKVKELAKKDRKFIESIDIAVNLGVDAKQSDQAVKGTVLLPHGSGKKIRAIVFTNNEEQAKIALEAGALMAGLDDLIAKIDGGFFNFDGRTRTNLKLNGGIVVVDFIYNTVNTSNRNYFLAFLHIFLEFLGFFCLLRLWANHKEIKYDDHTPK